MEGESKFGASRDEAEHQVERQRRVAAARGLDVDEFASFHAEDDDRADDRRP